MKLNCELFSAEIDDKYIIYSSDRAAFGGMLRVAPIWAQLLEQLGESFSEADITHFLSENGFTNEKAAGQAEAFTALLARAGLVEAEARSAAAAPEEAELILPEDDDTSYSTMNTGCYYNSCADCPEFNGWMDEDNEKPYIAPLL